MEHSASWEANRYSDSQKIPHILWYPKVIFAFTIARHLSLFLFRSTQSMAPNPILEDPL